MRMIKAWLIARYLVIVEEQRAKTKNHDGGASPAAFKRTCILMAGSLCPSPSRASVSVSTEKVSRAWIAHAPARRALIGRGAPAGREQGEIRSAAAFSWQHGGR